MKTIKSTLWLWLLLAVMALACFTSRGAVSTSTNYSLVLVTNATGVTVRVTAPSNEVQRATLSVLHVATNIISLEPGGAWAGSHYTFVEGSGTTAADIIGDYDLTLSSAGMWSGTSLSNNANGFSATSAEVPFATNVTTVMCWINTVGTPAEFGVWLTATNSFKSYFGSTGFIVAQLNGTTGLRSELISWSFNIEWKHVAILFDGSTSTGDVRMWVDGVEASLSLSSDTKTGTSNFQTSGVQLISDGIYPQNMRISDLRILPGDQTSTVGSVYALGLHP